MKTNINGYLIETDEKHVAAQGFWYLASKGGKSFFLKQYNPAKPNPPRDGSGSSKVYAKNLEKFERRKQYRERINRRIREFSMSGGNIVVPFDQFVCELPDSSGKSFSFYWEVTELIPNVISDEELESYIATLDMKQKLLIMMTAAGALKAVHEHGIVHSDLKLGNVLLAKSSSGNIVTKLIDFDGSYFLNDKNTLIAGDEVYCSPELYRFSMEEDDDSELRARLNEKSDIFSLGLIYHFYLSGHLPVGTDLSERLEKQRAKGKPIYCSEVLMDGGCLEISDKITNLNHRMLLCDMLDIDPARRPSATEVLKRLKEPDVEFVVEDPWPSHKILFKVDRLREAGYVIVKRIKDGGAEKYALITKSGTRTVFTKENLISKGLAAQAAREGVFDEPWPEHDIVFEIDKIKAKKYISVERAKSGGTNGYYFYKVGNTRQFCTVNNLLVLGYARKKGAAGGSGSASDTGNGTETTAGAGSVFVGCDFWPEHAGKYVFNTEKLLSKGYVRVEQGILSGKNGYELFTATGSKRFIMLQMLVMMEFVIPK